MTSIGQKNPVSISDFEPTFWDFTMYHTRPIVEAERKPVEGEDGARRGSTSVMWDRRQHEIPTGCLT